MASASCGIPCICLLSVLFLLLETEHGLGEDVGRGRVPNKLVSLQALQPCRTDITVAFKM